MSIYLANSIHVAKWAGISCVGFIPPCKGFCLKTLIQLDRTKNETGLVHAAKANPQADNPKDARARDVTLF